MYKDRYLYIIPNFRIWLESGCTNNMDPTGVSPYICIQIKVSILTAPNLQNQVVSNVNEASVSIRNTTEQGCIIHYHVKKKNCLCDTLCFFSYLGLKKKLTAISKERECGDLGPWIQSISNHLYWTAASTPDGNGKVMLQKWQSVANHVINIHQHEGSLFLSCQHGPPQDGDRRKKWLKRGTVLSPFFNFSFLLAKP